MKRPITPCQNCQGSGKAPLSRFLFATLSLFARGATLTAEQVHARQGLAEVRTAANNRLENLRKLGLIDRSRDGRAYHYFLTK